MIYDLEPGMVHRPAQGRGHSEGSIGRGMKEIAGSLLILIVLVGAALRFVRQTRDRERLMRSGNFKEDQSQLLVLIDFVPVTWPSEMRPVVPPELESRRPLCDIVNAVLRMVARCMKCIRPAQAVNAQLGGRAIRMTTTIRTRALWIAGAGALAAAVILAWKFFQPHDLPPGIARGNGRIEAVEIDVAAKTAGRVRDVLVGEGDFVRMKQELARMDTAVLDAQLREAEAQEHRARIGVDTAQSQVRQREAERQAAEAVVAQRKAESDAAQSRLARRGEVASQGFVSQAKLDDDRAAYQAASAAVGAALAQSAAAQAALGRARSDVIAAQAAVDAAAATIQRLRADLDDSVLKAPRDGRIQYLVARPGEVLSPGGVVLNMVDLADVSMTFFLPTEQAGRVALGAEARLVLDAAPQYVIPARISFVADVAQFTPKTVQTEEERQKLMFRIKARIDPDLLRRHLHQVKTGLPGMAYVRVDPQIDWPPELQVRLPQ